MNVLVGDVGGTKCLLAICDDRGRILLDRRYPSRDYAELHQVVAAFVREAGETPTRACFAVAGPVVNDQCKATNLPWVIDARALEAAAGIARVRLVNDFHAQALAVLELPPAELCTIHGGASVGGGPVAILGAGTGLGEAFLVNAGDRYEVVPSEGGHVDFAPTSERQIDLLRYLRATLGGRVSYERILSGSGLARLYEFLKSRGFARELPEVRAAMEREDPAAVVSRFGLGGQDPMCAFALDLFCEIYGQEAGNLALKVLAAGGVYVCGGIAPHIIDRLAQPDGPFERGYLDKGRMSPLVAAIPVRVVMNPKSGLVGAAVAATRL